MSTDEERDRGAGEEEGVGAGNRGGSRGGGRKRELERGERAISPNTEVEASALREVL